MRWIDIFLPEPGKSAEFDAICAEAAAAAAQLESFQKRDGLDAVTVIDGMSAVGRLLFKALNEARPGALAPERHRAGFSTLDLSDPVYNGLVGFHLVGRDGQLDLPWIWLHNGLEFMFRGHPLCVGAQPADPALQEFQRPWVMRQLRSRFLVGQHGESTLPAILPQLMGKKNQPPQILFVPGHGDRRIRGLIFREAEVVMSALDGGSLGRPLGSVFVPDGAVTPADLAAKSLAYQALHYAGPTSEAAQYDASEGQYWMNRMLEEASQLPDHQWEELAGMEGEVLGVDPITSMLDDISERYNREGGVSVPVGQEAQAGSGGTVRPAAAGNGGWLLPDGPVDPLQISRGGGMPPLVFSNSYRALPQLGRRCAAAGASTFVGPMVPLYSRPARHFAGRFYASMAAGWCAGAALWQAGAAIRDEFGKEHPAWLSYGIQGSGSLALPYL